MRNFLTMIVATVLAVGPGTARAGEATFGIDTEILRDDNVFRAPKGSPLGEDGDWSVRVTPRIKVEEPQGNVTWSFEYLPAYEYFMENNALRGWDHDVRGDLAWQVTKKTSISLSDRFRRYGLESRFNDSTDVAAGDDPAAATRQGLERIRQNQIDLAISHTLSRRNQLTLDAGYQTIEQSQGTASDQVSYSASLSHFFSWRTATSFGPSLAWSRQVQIPKFSRRTETDFLNLSLRVLHRFDRTLLLDVSVGPALVFSEEQETRLDPTIGARYPGPALLDVGTCPTLKDGTPFFSEECEELDLFRNETILTENNIGLPTNEQELTTDFTVGPLLVNVNEAALIQQARSQGALLESNDILESGGSESTYFANISLRKTWENWDLLVGFRRSDDSSASNFGVTSISDRLFGRLDWRASRKLRLVLNASWIRREQEQEVAGFVTGLTNGSVTLDTRTCVFGAIPSTCGFAGRLIRFDNAAEASSLRARLLKRDFESTQLRVRLGARYRLRRHIVLIGSLTWISDETKGDLTNNGDIERFIARAGVEYEFEPYRF